MPAWVKNEIDKTDDFKRIASKFDLRNAVFHEEPVPTSNRDKRLKDPNKVNFFLFDWPYSSYDRRNHDWKNVNLAVYNDDYYKWIPELKNFGFGTWKDVVDHTVKYAWIDVHSGDSADELRTARREMRAGALALQRAIDGWWGNRDKSGYIVDRLKYKKILSQRKGFEKYTGYLDQVNGILKDAKSLINDFVDKVNDPYTLDRLARVYTDYTTSSRYRYSYLAGATKYLRDLLSIANDLNEAIKNVEADQPASEYEYKLNELDKSVGRAEDLFIKLKNALGIK